MSENVQVSAVLIEMDCLMDTRMGTLVTHYSDEQVLDVLKNGYHDREFDNFHGIDYDEFHSLYRNRDKVVLKNSLRTNIMPVIDDFVRETIRNNISTPHVFIPKVIVNIYPYDLTMDEQSLIRDVMVQATRNHADIEIVSLSYDQLTPSYLRQEVSLMVLYDYDQWLEAQTINGSFKKQACPEIGMFSPAIYKKPELTDNDKRIHAQFKMPPFEFLAKQIEPFVRAIFLPAHMFSIPVRVKT